MKDGAKLLSQHAYERIKSDIIRCGLSPGTDWTEQQLRSRYQLSIATSRAAIAKLVQEGLLLSVPRRGYQVPSVTLRDVTEVFDLRAIIEPGVARLAAEVISETEIRELQRLISEMRRRDLQEQEDFIQANRDLHIAIAKASGNARCARLVSRLLDEAERILYVGVTSIEQNKKFLDSHEQIVKLMADRDLDSVEAIVRDHVNSARRLVIDAIYSDSKVLDVNLA